MPNTGFGCSRTRIPPHTHTRAPVAFRAPYLGAFATLPGPPRLIPNPPVVIATCRANQGRNWVISTCPTTMSSTADLLMCRPRSRVI